MNSAYKILMRIVHSEIASVKLCERVRLLFVVCATLSLSLLISYNSIKRYSSWQLWKFHSATYAMHECKLHRAFCFHIKTVCSCNKWHVPRNTNILHWLSTFASTEANVILSMQRIAAAKVIQTVHEDDGCDEADNSVKCQLHLIMWRHATEFPPSVHKAWKECEQIVLLLPHSHR